MSGVTMIARKNFLKRIGMTSEEFQKLEKKHFENFLNGKKKTYFITSADEKVYVEVGSKAPGYYEKLTYSVITKYDKKVICLQDYTVCTHDGEYQNTLDFENFVLRNGSVSDDYITLRYIARHGEILISEIMQSTNLFNTIEFAKHTLSDDEKWFNLVRNAGMVDSEIKLKRTKINKFKGFERYSTFPEEAHEDNYTECTQILEAIKTRRIGNDWWANDINVNTLPEQLVLTMFSISKSNKHKLISFSRDNYSGAVTLEDYSKTYVTPDLEGIYTVDAKYDKENRNYVVLIGRRNQKISIGFVLDTTDFEVVVNVVNQNMRKIEINQCTSLIDCIARLNYINPNGTEIETAHKHFHDEMMREEFGSIC